MALIDNYGSCDLKGSIKAIKRGNKYYYYFQHFDSEKDKYVSTYLKKDNLDIAKLIVQRDYYKSLRNVLNDELYHLKTVHEISFDELTDNCYYMMDDGKKCLIKPIKDTIQYKLNEWNNEKYEKNEKYPESLIFETDRGEIVRSKSEELIANFLYSIRDKVDYKYERPMAVIVNGKEVVIHPDFTIINIKTGEIFILEHVSRIDLPEYHDSFVWKHRIYTETGLYQNGKIIYSFESEGVPLNMKYIKKLIFDIVLND